MFSQTDLVIIYTLPRVHKTGRFEKERVTSIEACSPVKIIELC